MEVLLIVPYGIETLLMVSLLYLTLNLLIVPYGIETCNLLTTSFCFFCF